MNNSHSCRPALTSFFLKLDFADRGSERVVAIAGGGATPSLAASKPTYSEEPNA